MFALFQIVTSCGQLALVTMLNTEAMLTNESVTFTMFYGCIYLLRAAQYDYDGNAKAEKTQTHTHTYTHTYTYLQFM